MITLRLAAFVALLVCIASVGAAATTYNARDLGLGQAVAINNKGQVVVNADGHVYVWSRDSAVVDLGIGTGSDINGTGQVCGTVVQPGVPGATAVRWNLGGSRQDLGSGFAYSINSSGAVVGMTYEKTSFLWSTSIGWSDLGLGNSLAAAINDSGQIAGQSHSGYFRDVAGAVTMFGPPDVYTYVNDMNDSGQVAGTVYDVGSGAYRAYLWSKGAGVSFIDSSTGWAGAGARGINATGMVVGSYATLQGYADGYAFVWTAATGMQALEPLDGVGSAVAYRVNDAGYIVGESNGHAVLWEPVPEPSSLLVLAGGLASAGGLAFKRRRM